MSVFDSTAALQKASDQVLLGRFKRARRIYQSVLAQDPDDARALASMARIDAELGRMTFEEALERVRNLMAQHPDSDRLPPVAIGILAKLKRVPEATAEAKALLERFPDSSVALQVLANMIQVDPATRLEPGTQKTAWDLYKRALEFGPLSNLCYKSVAFYAGRQAEPARAKEALVGSTWSERAGIQTRALGPRALFGIFALGAVAAVASGNGHLGWGIVLQMMTIGWGAWGARANKMVCCRKCRNGWIALTGFAMIYFVGFDVRGIWPYANGAVILLALILYLTDFFTFEKTPVSPSRQRSSVS